MSLDEPLYLIFVDIFINKSYTDKQALVWRDDYLSLFVFLSLVWMLDFINIISFSEII